MKLTLEQRRILVGVFALATMGTVLVPLPEVDAALKSLRFPEDGGFVPQRFRLFALFLGPYLNATVLLLLASGALPALRALREGDPAGRRTFGRGILAGTIVIAFVQAAASAVFFANYSVTIAEIPAAPWMLAVLLVLADMLLLAAAVSVTRWGVGNGIAIALAAGVYLPLLAQGLIAERSVLSCAAVPVLAVLYQRYLRHAMEWPLVPLGRPAGAAAHGEEGDTRTEPRLRMRHNLVGVAPALTAGALLALPVAIASFFPAGRRPEWLEGLQGPTLLHDLCWCAPAVVACSAVLAVAYDPRGTASVLARQGYKLEGVGEAELPQWLASRMWTCLPEGIAFTILIGLGPQWLMRLTHCSPVYAGSLGWPLFLVVAVVTETLRHDRALRVLAPSSAGEDRPVHDGDSAENDPGVDEGAGTDPGDEPGADWRDWMHVDTELEGELVCDRLERAGIRSQLASNRATVLTGTLASWEWSPARFPSLAIHRSLGGGAVSVHVCAGDEARAAAVLSRVEP